MLLTTVPLNILTKRGRRCETIRTGENDNSREKMQNVRGDRSAHFIGRLEQAQGQALGGAGDRRLCHELCLYGAAMEWFRSANRQRAEEAVPSLVTLVLPLLKGNADSGQTKHTM